MRSWLVWSNEHRGWWKAGGWGYTTLTHRAGVFTKEDAEAICAKANLVPRDPPNEVMVLAPDPGLARIDLWADRDVDRD